LNLRTTAENLRNGVTGGTTTTVATGGQQMRVRDV
jgi:hypothetical protein